jgi:hypothetical protein
MSKSKVVVSENDLLQRRILHAQFVASLAQDEGSVAAQTIAAYSELLEEALLDAAVEASREMRTAGLPAPLPPPCPLPPARPLPPGVPALLNGKPIDMFGQHHPGSATDMIICNECGRKVQAGVFARHLSTCLQLGRIPRPTRR